MIKKKKIIGAGVVLVILTAVLTTAVLNIFEIPVGNKVYISEIEYEQIRRFQEDFKLLPYLKKFLEENYYEPLDQEALQTGVYKGLFDGAGDPYTRYLTKEEYEKLISATAGEFGGVGVVMSMNEEGYAEVVSVVKGGPAVKAGVEMGDLIVMVDDEDCRGMALSDVSALLKGEEGTKVKLSILRDGEMKSFTLKRSMIEETSVYGEVIEDNMGYIRISSFDLNTGAQFEEALQDLERKGVDGLVIDLRANMGGVVEQSVAVADLLMDEGVVVYLEDGKGEKKYYRTIDGRTALNYVLLVNKATASASEVLAAGVQDNGEGTILGTQTYGKGIMQKTWRMRNGDGLEITFAQYFSPKGKVIHEVGIMPDVVVELEESDLEGNYIVNDRQLKEAVKLLREQAAGKD